MFGLKRALIRGRITVVELEIRVVELKMKKKRTQTVENTTEDELKMTAEAKWAKRWIRRARVGPPEG